MPAERGASGPRRLPLALLSRARLHPDRRPGPGGRVLRARAADRARRFGDPGLADAGPSRSGSAGGGGAAAGPRLGDPPQHPGLAVSGREGGPRVAGLRRGGESSGGGPATEPGRDGDSLPPGDGLPGPRRSRPRARPSGPERLRQRGGGRPVRSPDGRGLHDAPEPAGPPGSRPAGRRAGRLAGGGAAVPPERRDGAGQRGDAAEPRQRPDSHRRRPHRAGRARGRGAPRSRLRRRPLRHRHAPRAQRGATRRPSIDTRRR